MSADWSRRFLPPVREHRQLYVIQDPGSGFLKIGKAFDPEGRLSQFQTGTPHQLTIVHTHCCEDDAEAPALEPMVHRILAEHRVRGEWFNVTLDQAKAAIAQARAQLFR
ncbi:GIY-YIG nuclease family protein [Bradyrhizobium barranii subsp. apii]|uniref:GIY-YIG nuclease family protein n=2 Tax=Bradyrhizobium barranii TaxID=2992140 RepID=A0A8T5VSI0_9BRAD|nr:GIY-YIG nuclease family protein [Bradyrhizobium barranii]UPT89574.1 GIY-YIG nuclease family protein [Bradyrhizobium barranii subsp. apii]